MEFVVTKRNRNRKRKRQLKKRRRQQTKFEVKSVKRQRFVSERCNTSVTKKSFTSTMQAESFWRNYMAAEEWQKRHNVTWWRSRCFALEYENQVLRDKLWSLAHQNENQDPIPTQWNECYKDEDEGEAEEEVDSNTNNDNLEFHIDEEMISFLEQSIRHKMELKLKREMETATEEVEENDGPSIRGGAEWVKARNTNAKLLYGDSSSTILAMETALQATVNRHKDKAKPQFWPIIPLKI